jgi:hypothetical protein
MSWKHPVTVSPADAPTRRSEGINLVPAVLYDTEGSVGTLMGLIYTMLRDATETRMRTPQIQHAQDHPVQSATALAKRDPQYIVKDTTGITPVDLTVEVPAVDSSTLLKYICQVLTTYARFEKPEHVITIALWIASTWFAEPTSTGMDNGKLMFEAHPRLMLIAEKSSGKNRVMKILRRLVRNPSIIGTGVVTSYGVRNELSAGRTVFIDEYHKRVGTTGKKQSDLQEDVLAYSREAGSIDGRGGTINEQSLFGPIVLAAQPSIRHGLQGEALDDLFDRCFIIPMPHHVNPADKIPHLDEEFERKCKDLHDTLELWGAALYEGMAGRMSKKYLPIHPMPEHLTGRLLEVSEVLAAVADRAVNPDVMEANFKATGVAKDTEWAEMCRDAVQVLKLGHTNDPRKMMERLAQDFGEAE